ncbi:hypothetical protein N657DRAFT_720784 [Parathielavia appendiculata]|uniref:Uncharacterized protein n=1 Tax=Parathielavia appendiculata TaxID=2587402 RepID=A0AAN6TXE0_9PEZI|nr:hypothetical protein N657DRAFT_720784 [Parathielavia appendiculata]
MGSLSRHWRQPPGVRRNEQGEDASENEEVEDDEVEDDEEVEDIEEMENDKEVEDGESDDGDLEEDGPSENEASGDEESENELLEGLPEPTTAKEVAFTAIVSVLFITSLRNGAVRPDKIAIDQAGRLYNKKHPSPFASHIGNYREEFLRMVDKLSNKLESAHMKRTIEKAFVEFIWDLIDTGSTSLKRWNKLKDMDVLGNGTELVLPDNLDNYTEKLGAYITSYQWCLGMTLQLKDRLVVAIDQLRHGLYEAMTMQAHICWWTLRTQGPEIC